MGRKKENGKSNGTTTNSTTWWFKTTENQDKSNGVLTAPFAHLLAPFAHLLFAHSSLCSRVPLFVYSLTYMSQKQAVLNLSGVGRSHRRMVDRTARPSKVTMVLVAKKE